MQKPIKYAIKLELGITPAMDKTLTQWRRRQPDLPTRTESIRRLVEIGLQVENEKRMESNVRRPDTPDD